MSPNLLGQWARRTKTISVITHEVHHCAVITLTSARPAGPDCVTYWPQCVATYTTRGVLHTLHSGGGYAQWQWDNKYKYTHRWTDKEANTVECVVDVHPYTHKPEENKNPCSSTHGQCEQESRAHSYRYYSPAYNRHLCRLVSVSQRLSHEGDFCIPWQWLTGGFISMVASSQSPSRALLWQGRRSQRSASAQCAKATQRAEQATQPDIRAGNDDSWALWPSRLPLSLSVQHVCCASLLAGERLRRSRIMSHVCSLMLSVTPTGLSPVVLTGLITCVSTAFHSVVRVSTAFMVHKARACGQLRKVSRAYVFSACYKFQSEITSCYLFIFTLCN